MSARRPDMRLHYIATFFACYWVVFWVYAWQCESVTLATGATCGVIYFLRSAIEYGRAPTTRETP